MLEAGRYRRYPVLKDELGRTALIVVGLPLLAIALGLTGRQAGDGDYTSLRP